MYGFLIFLLFLVEKATLKLDFKETRAEGTYETPMDKRFRRRQSDLYQMMHTSPDPEIEIELLEQALREVNDQLITEKECEYIFYVSISRYHLGLCFSLVSAGVKKTTRSAKIKITRVKTLNFSSPMNLDMVILFFELQASQKVI